MNWSNKTLENTAFIIPARLGSTRLPRKIIREFAGSSLFEIALQKIKEIKNFPQENIFIQICDQELIDIASNYELNIFRNGRTIIYGTNDDKIAKSLYAKYIGN